MNTDARCLKCFLGSHPRLRRLERNDVNGSSRKARVGAKQFILSVLGFENKSEYDAALTVVRMKLEEKAKEEALQWSDEEKESQIRSMSEKGDTFDEIRELFFLGQEEQESRSEAIHRRIVIDNIILRVLGLRTKDEFKRQRHNLLARNRYRRTRETGFFEGKKAALERDGHRCVVTGEIENLTIHHIDGNESNNNLVNLVTVSRKVQTILHNGVRAMAPKDIEYWQRQAPPYAERLRERLDLIQKYVAHVRSKGHESACLECISGYNLFGPAQHHKKLHITDRMKRLDYSYWVAVLEPTGLHEEPKEFVPRGYSDWDKEDDEDDLGSDELGFDEGLEDEEQSGADDLDDE